MNTKSVVYFVILSLAVALNASAQESPDKQAQKVQETFKQEFPKLSDVMEMKRAQNEQARAPKSIVETKEARLNELISSLIVKNGQQVSMHRDYQYRLETISNALHNREIPLDFRVEKIEKSLLHTLHSVPLNQRADVGRHFVVMLDLHGMRITKTSGDPDEARRLKAVYAALKNIAMDFRGETAEYAKPSMEAVTAIATIGQHAYDDDYGLKDFDPTARKTAEAIVVDIATNVKDQNIYSVAMFHARRAIYQDKTAVDTIVSTRKKNGLRVDEVVGLPVGPVLKTTGK